MALKALVKLFGPKGVSLLLCGKWKFVLENNFHAL